MTYICLYLIVGILWAYFTDHHNEDLYPEDLWKVRFLSAVFWPVEVLVILFLVATGRE